MQEIKQAVESAVIDCFSLKLDAQLERPEERFGDYSTNIALRLAGQLLKKPSDIAKQLQEKLKNSNLFEDVEVAGPGFINITIKNHSLISMIEGAASPDFGKTDQFKAKEVVVEYSDPNPFKILHAGHLYTSVVGDAIANLFEAAGANVHRVNFGGDVGMHVAKTIWAMTKDLDGVRPDKLAEKSAAERSEWMSQCYIVGNNSYEDDEIAKKEIMQLNKKIYEIRAKDDRESPLGQLYWTTRNWSYDYFKEFYKSIGTSFEKFYPEGDTAEPGLLMVQQHLGDVFEQSDGAVVFRGEKYGLHTRVFINSEGLPTYETKDLGLAAAKWADFNYDQSIIITGNEQQQYLAVVLKALEQFAPQMAARTRHITHGIVKLAGGIKMSSRTGNILRAQDILDVAAAANKEATGSEDVRVYLGAIKYSFLKNKIGADIIYDPQESVSLVGNSGPYLQYAHARATSILSQAENVGSLSDLQLEERSLARKISEYPEVVDKAVAEMMPHYVATYLYELAQVFNRFYENNRVVGSERAEQRGFLVKAYANVLAQGLKILNIETPERI